ncbi:MAG: DUF4093 domain-containing protein [Ruminococcaceae bacterium]|nr:DUF4093 domain-containing protein [Oscillospiraceae bacterium]
MIKKLKIDKPIIVEGKYDKIKLDSIVDARVIATNGFGVFKSEETKSFLRRVCETTEIIILCDSDGAGRLIRNHLKSFLPADRLINVYIPDIEGKEKRKKTPSKAGTLGVEGMDAELLRNLLEPYSVNAVQNSKGGITKQHLYADGLLGGANASEKRLELQTKLGLPKELSSSALLDAINLLCSYDEYKELLK